MRPSFVVAMKRIAVHEAVDRFRAANRRVFFCSVLYCIGRSTLALTDLLPKFRAKVLVAPPPEFDIFIG